MFPLPSLAVARSWLPHVLWSVFGLTAAGLAWTVGNAPFLGVQHIAFSGFERTTERQLHHLADVRLGEPMWSVHVGRIEAAVAAHPWIDRVRVVKRWPNQLAIEVEERKVAALLLDADRVFFVDAHGRRIAQQRSGDADYPYLTGMGESLDRQYAPLAEAVRGRAMWLMREVVDRDLATEATLSEVAFSPDIGFIVYADNLEMVVGLDAFDERLDLLAAVADRGLPRTPHRIDVAADPAGRQAIVESLSSPREG